MSIWVYLAGNIITGVTIIISAAFAMGRMSQIISNLAEQITQVREDSKEQLTQMRGDFKQHQEDNQAAFDVFHATLLQLVIQLTGRDGKAPASTRKDN